MSTVLVSQTVHVTIEATRKTDQHGFHDRISILIHAPRREIPGQGRRANDSARVLRGREIQRHQRKKPEQGETSHHSF